MRHFSCLKCQLPTTITTTTSATTTTTTTTATDYESSSINTEEISETTTFVKEKLSLTDYVEVWRMGDYLLMAKKTSTNDINIGIS